MTRLETASHGNLKFMAAEKADGSNYRDDSKTIAENADGSNYRDDSKNEEGELADGSNLQSPARRRATSKRGTRSR